MKIWMVSNRACIRVLKESIALTNYGHEVNLLCQARPAGAAYYNSVTIFEDLADLADKVKVTDADVWHIHNEPDSYVKVVKENTDRPVVYDVHDIDSMRSEYEVANQDEKDAAQYADGIIHVCNPCLEYHQKEYKECKGKPTRIIYSFIPQCFMNDTILKEPAWDSAVYEGGISTTPPMQDSDSELVSISYRYHPELFHAFIKQGYVVNVYPSSPPKNLLYEAMGCYVAAPTHIYPNMLHALRPHGIGIVGSVYKSPLLLGAMPNKLFEYMSRGVVPVCYNADEAAKFALENECGVKLESLDNIREQIGDIKKLRKNVLKIKDTLVMENQVPDIISLYKELGA